MTAVERGERRADAMGARGEEELLYRTVDGRPEAGRRRVRRVAQHREDPDGCLLEVIGQVFRGEEPARCQPLVAHRGGQDLLPALAVDLLEVLPVPGRDPLFYCWVGHHDPAPLLV